MTFWKPFGIVVGLGSFAGSHMILSHEPVREKLVKEYGAGNPFPFQIIL